MAFSLQVDVGGAAPANDTCGAAIDLPLNTSLPGTTLVATADYSAASSWYGGACAYSLSGPDVAYKFTATTAGPYTVRVVPQLGFDPGLAVLSACAANSCLANTDVGNAGDPDALVLDAAAGATYYVIVDSWFSSALGGRGGFTVSVAH